MENQVISTEDRLVNFIVGGAYFSMSLSNIAQHKDCYFQSVIKNEWCDNADTPIVIDRDGVLFRYIVVYIYTGQLHLPYREPKESLALLVSIRREADYFNLTDLVSCCNGLIKETFPLWCKQTSFSNLYESYDCVMETSHPSELPNVFNRHFHSVVSTGKFSEEQFAGTIYKNSSIGSMDIPGLLEAASKVDDTDKRKNLHTINLRYRDTTETVYNIQSYLPTIPNIHCGVTDPALFIYTEGGYLTQQQAVGVNSLSEIGTLNYIIHAPEEGGTISVTQGGIKHSISRVGEYIMSSFDCVKNIDIVTSGTLVFLRFILTKDGRDRDMCDMKCIEGCQEINAQLASELIAAIHDELSIVENGGNGVVLCVSKLYTLVSFDPATLQLETDPDTLKGRDALLYTTLQTHFEVELVTVYVERKGEQNEGCVIGPLPVCCGTSSKVKIITPPYGFGDCFKVKSDNITKFATLFTGLYIKTM